MKFNICEDGHFVALIDPGHELNGADHHFAVVNMENWSHVDFGIHFAASPRAAAVITVESCSNWVTLGGSPTTATKIPFQYYQRVTDQTTAGNDVDSAIQTQSTAATGIVPATGTDNILYVITLDASQLLAGHIGFRIDIVNAGAGCLAYVFALCSGARYAGSARPSVLAS